MGWPLGRKLVSIGVGKTGTAGEGARRSFGAEDMLLTEVFGEVSCSLTLKLLLRKLEEEKFLRSPPPVLVENRAGELGIDVAIVSLSAEVTFVRPDAVDET